MHFTYRPLIWIVEVDLDHDFKFAPASFCDFIRGLCQDSVLVGIAVVEFEVDFLHIGGHVLIFIGSDVNSPLMCVAILLSFLAKVLGYVSIHD